MQTKLQIVHLESPFSRKILRENRAARSSSVMSPPQTNEPQPSPIKVIGSIKPILLTDPFKIIPWNPEGREERKLGMILDPLVCL